MIETRTNGARTPGRWLVLFLLCTAFFMVVTDSTSIFAALPSIQHDLSFAGGHWVVTAFAIVSGGFLLLGGRLADHLGRYRMFLGGTMLFLAASLLCGFSWSPGVLIFARAIQGLSAAITTPAALAILLRSFPIGVERNKALGIWGALGGIGATAGLLLGGPITEFLGWEWVFFVNVPLAAVVLIAGPFALERDKKTGGNQRTFDFAGAVTITAAITTFVYTIVGIPRSGWLSAHTWGGGVAFGVLLLVFVIVERRSPEPLVPFRIFRSRALVGGNVVVLIAGMAVDGMLYLFTLYFQAVLGYSAIHFGLTMTIMTGSSVFAVYLGQGLVNRFGFRVVAVSGMLLLAVGSLLLARVSQSTGDGVVSALLIFGFGMGAAFVASQIAALSDVDSSDEGLASGLEETSFAIGSPLGVAIVAAVSLEQAERLSGEGSTLGNAAAGFAIAFGVIALLTVIGCFAAMMLLRRREPTVPESR